MAKLKVVKRRTIGEPVFWEGSLKRRGIVDSVQGNRCTVAWYTKDGDFIQKDDGWRHTELIDRVVIVRYI